MSLSDIPAEGPLVVNAAQFAGAIVCYAKCVDCQFGQCPDRSHTWMDCDDLDADPKIPMPTSVEDWERLAKDRPCGCHCERDRRAARPDMKG